LNAISRELPAEVWRGERFALADLLRAFAAVGIVWHHLSLYAPRSDLADQFAPSVGYFLFNHALYAVAIFFVLGGLTSSLDKRFIQRPDGKMGLGELMQGILDRYLRLAIPYLIMLFGLLGLVWLTDRFGWPLYLIDSFSWYQFASHLFLIQNLLGFENFSAGTWYLCIELQWSCLIVVLTFLANRFQPDHGASVLARTLLLFPLGLWSAFVWSRSDRWEAFLLFFAAQYVLGIFLGWTLQGRLPTWVLSLYSLSVAGSLMLNPRPQLMISLLVVPVLFFGYWRTKDWVLPASIRWLSDVSYSLFLVHYMVNGVVLRILDDWSSQGAVQAAAGMLIAFACSLVAAFCFHRWVEGPWQRWVRSKSLRRAERLEPIEVDQRLSGS
jgi:peptidoglycan/LPS O-acetylase OafA/YrhL